MGKHRERMAQDLALRGVAKSTAEVYLKYARKFVAHFGRSADQLGTEHVRRWLLWQLKDKKLSASTVNVAIAALRQLFTTLGRPNVMRHIRGVRQQHPAPDVLSGTEIERLLSAATDVKHRAMFALLYGAGLRIAELLALTTADIDSQRMVIHVRDTKTRHDRIVPLSPRMLLALRILEGAPADRTVALSWSCTGQPDDAGRRIGGHAQLREERGDFETSSPSSAASCVRDALARARD